MAKRDKKIPKIVERKLGREKAWGLCYQGIAEIEIDPRLKPERRLIILCHELLHHCFEDLSEQEIDRAGIVIGKALWKQNYRRVEQ